VKRGSRTRVASLFTIESLIRKRLTFVGVIDSEGVSRVVVLVEKPRGFCCLKWNWVSVKDDSRFKGERVMKRNKDKVTRLLC
jgi:hypothetical protein